MTRGKFLNRVLQHASRFEGVKYISQITMGSSAAVAIYVLFAGPTNFISNLFFRAAGQYASDFFAAKTTDNLNNAFLAMLEGMPLVNLTAIITISLVALFFISAVDDNTFVLSMLSSKGSLQPTRPVLTAWGNITGIRAVVVLLVGGLAALQLAAMLSALPFTSIVALLASR